MCDGAEILYIGGKGHFGARGRSLTSTDRLTRISPAELDGLLNQARAEQWTQLVLIGPDIGLSSNVENWPGELKAAPRIFQLTALTEWLAGKLRSLQGLTTLNLSGNTIGDEGARAPPCLI